MPSISGAMLFVISAVVPVLKLCRPRESPMNVPRIPSPVIAPATWFSMFLWTTASVTS